LSRNETRPRELLKGRVGLGKFLAEFRLRRRQPCARAFSPAAICEAIGRFFSRNNFEFGFQINSETNWQFSSTKIGFAPGKMAPKNNSK
jgi:hypothetical protein